MGVVSKNAPLPRSQGLTLTNRPPGNKENPHRQPPRAQPPGSLTLAGLVGTPRPPQPGGDPTCGSDQVCKASRPHPPARPPPRDPPGGRDVLNPPGHRGGRGTCNCSEGLPAPQQLRRELHVPQLATGRNRQTTAQGHFLSRGPVLQAVVAPRAVAHTKACPQRRHRRAQGRRARGGAGRPAARLPARSPPPHTALAHGVLDDSTSVAFQRHLTQSDGASLKTQRSSSVFQRTTRHPVSKLP